MYIHPVKSRTITRVLDVVGFKMTRAYQQTKYNYVTRVYTSDTMASPFFMNVVAATKSSLKRDVQLSKDADVVQAIVERRIKKAIMDSASKGFTTAEVNLNFIGNVDIVSTYSVQDILFKKITPTFVPVADRLTTIKDFADFQIGQAEANVFIFDWTHAVVKPEPSAEFPPKTSHVAAPVNTTPAPPANTPTECPYKTIANTYPFYNSIGPSAPAADAEIEALLSALFPYLMGSVNTV
ncbi:hypothetical protein ATCVGM07011_262L [Acanthocystis turfacea Chlorella virus GM0701.1]|nr:hypothetical protein ATCVGM07011_262L [Acanthocystis turfacea Chlorella virus GM0701.1]